MIRLAGHNIFHRFHFAAHKVSHVDMIVITVFPAIPVTIHQIVVDVGIGFVEIAVKFGTRTFFDLGRNNKQHLIFGRSIEKPVDRLLDIGYLCLGSILGIDVPEFTIAQESDRFARRKPCQRTFASGCPCKLFLVCPIGIHHIHLRIALVLGDTVIRNGISHTFAVGRNAHVSYPSECPQYFGRHLSVLNLHIRLSDNRCTGSLFLLLFYAAACHHCCHGAHCCYFFHWYNVYLRP